LILSLLNLIVFTLWIGGYVAYKRLYKIHSCDAFFVTRAKDNMNYRQLYSHSKDKSNGVLYDQTVMLNNHYASKNYPEKLRRIKFRDEETGKILHIPFQ